MPGTAFLEALWSLPLLLSMMPQGVECPLRSAVAAVSPPSSLGTPSLLLLVGWDEAEKILTLL